MRVLNLHLVVGVLLSALVCLASGEAAKAQQASLPEPVYWSQQLFMIPYQWDSNNTATQATTVKLYLSQDQGRTWNEISKAEPQLQGFTYQAPGDGEYWFAIRTFDAQGNGWPTGPHRPELRVIVDTQNPTVTNFQAAVGADNKVTATWLVSDTNLDPGKVTLQYRTPTSSVWMDAPSGEYQLRSPTDVQGSTTWQVPPSTDSVWVRLAVRDLAGNVREAGAHAQRGVAPNSQLAGNAYGAPGYTPTSTVSNAHRLPPLPRETWPSDGESQVPLGSAPVATNPTSTLAKLPELNRPAASPPNAMAASDPTPIQWSAAGSTTITNPYVNTPPATRAAAPQGSPFQLPQLSSGGHGNAPNTHPASAQGSTSPWSTSAALPSLDRASNNSQQFTAGSTTVSQAAQPKFSAQPNTNLPIQHLSSLEFEIGYNVDTAGTAGVTRVELWGTENGGQSWQRLAVDTDNRSPILVAVPKPGDYGLAIVVATAGGIDPVRPRPGDVPQMMVRVDTTPPVARLTAIRQGTGAMADHLNIEWQPADSTATSEQVTLAYSTSPAGPWIPVSSGLPNSGHYSWRLGRHLPPQFYLRLEAADQAGNTATDQTKVPVQISLPTPSGTLGTARGL